MANDVQRNPWILDSTTLAPLWKGYIRMEAMTWQDVTAAGNQLILQDQNGKEVWSMTAPGSGYFNYGKPMWINGLIVKRIDSGKVYITVN
jgi:outer membrane protein assembly factor BamB